MMLDLEAVNRDLGNDTVALIDWAVGLGKKTICTTNFRPYAAVLLHHCVQVQPDMPIVWMDNGYATPATYRFADELARLLKLNLKIYHPSRSRAHREAVDGAPPSLGDPRLAEFTKEVKLDPFDRALREIKPDVWFTGVRAEDTAERAAMQPVSFNADGMLKVAPLLHWSSKQMHDYCKKHGLPNNFDYFDPTKLEAHAECGLHTSY